MCISTFALTKLIMVHLSLVVRLKFTKQHEPQQLIYSIIKHNLSATEENCTLPPPVIKTPLCISHLCVLQLQH